MTLWIEIDVCFIFALEIYSMSSEKKYHLENETASMKSLKGGVRCAVSPRAPLFNVGVSATECKQI